MELESIIKDINDRRSFENETSGTTFELIDSSIRKFPSSSLLLCIKGDAIQLGNEDSKYELKDALECYQEAIKLDPDCAEAHESIGYYYDVIEEDFEKSKAAFEIALKLEQRINSYIGLARVRIEMGEDRQQILSFLKESPFATHDAVIEFFDEIQSGLWD